MTFIQEITNSFSEELIDKTKLQIGEDKKKIGKAISLSVPTLMASLYKRSKTDIGLKQIHQFLSKNANGGVEFLDECLEDEEKTKKLVRDTEVILSQLLPSSKSMLTQLIGSQVATRNSSSAAMLSLATHVLLDKLGKKQHNSNWDRADLAEFLYEQYQAISSEVSADFSDKINGALGFRQAQAFVRPTITTESKKKESPKIAVEEPEERTPIAIPWKAMGLVLGLGVLGVGGYWGWNEYKNRSVEESEEESSLALSDSLTVPKDTLQGNIVSEETKPVSTELLSTFGTAIDAYLADTVLRVGKTFTLKNVEFIDGTAELDATSSMVVDELTSVLKKHPKSQIKIIGYANDGTPAMGNKTLSAKRVLNLKQKLITSGIDFMRINAVGLGSGVKADSLNPNPGPGFRRIDVKVVAK